MIRTPCRQPSGRARPWLQRALTQVGDPELNGETFELPDRRPPAQSDLDASWRLHAACRAVEGDLFFAADGERGLAKRRRERAAKAICVGCPVREECASYAIATREPHGVWGGLSERERERIWRGLDHSPYAS
jgi:WhiB family transcriptional regulator, redox-sensing transcriptional regulator